jgi:hypothetical protein
VFQEKAKERSPKLREAVDFAVTAEDILLVQREEKNARVIRILWNEVPGIGGTKDEDFERKIGFRVFDTDPLQIVILPDTNALLLGKRFETLTLDRFCSGCASSRLNFSEAGRLVLDRMGLGLLDVELLPLEANRWLLFARWNTTGEADRSWQLIELSSSLETQVTSRDDLTDFGVIRQEVGDLQGNMFLRTARGAMPQGLFLSRRVDLLRLTRWTLEHTEIKSAP